jgi:hypothetical protein
MVTGAHCGVLSVGTSLGVASGVLEAAARCFRRATALDAKQPRPWIGLGLCEASPLVRQHCLLSAVERGGGGVALCNLGLLCIQLGRLDSGQEVLTQAQCDDPSNEAMWAGLGMIYDHVRGECRRWLTQPCGFGWDCWSWRSGAPNVLILAPPPHTPTPNPRMPHLVVRRAPHNRPHRRGLGRRLVQPT